MILAPYWPDVENFGSTFYGFSPILSRQSWLKEKIVAGETVAAFWAVSFLLVVTPGADWAYAIAAGLRHRLVFPAVGGLLAGHLAATAVVAVGVGAWVVRSPLVLTVLTAAGAAYLVWLGIGMLVHPAALQTHAENASGSWLRQAAKGAGISGFNPKVFLLFLALLPQFTNPNASWPVRRRFWCLGWCTLPAAP
jgi:threonine/homoserine/homoserine lactone efflux protein